MRINFWNGIPEPSEKLSKFNTLFRKGKGGRTMKKYVVCGDCGRKLCKAEPGSVVELVCPKCKKPVVAMVKEDGIVMFDQSIKKAT